MKVTVFQTSPVLLDLKTNLEDIIEKIFKGRKEGADLIVFPELALTGYFVGQRYHEVALRLDSKEIRNLVAATKGTAAVVGFIEESPAMNFYNSALVAADGEIIFAYRKLNLPNYGVFEERKYFSPGKQIPVFKHHDFSIAVFICNDLWHPSLPYLGVVQKADIFVTVFNSSEGSMGSEFSNIESWEIINKFYSRIFGIYDICANRVGEETFENGRPAFINTDHTENKNLSGEDTCTRKTYHFWGGSEVINPFGQRMAKAEYHRQDEISTELARDPIRRKKILLPYLKNDDPFFTHRELERILYGKKHSYL
jgi:predicted amidohydrolase